jgi:hypothetical protein
MPGPEVRSLNDYAVLWAASAVGEYGRNSVSAPVEIKVRWEDSRQQSTDPQNVVESRPATVYVDRDITINSVLWHGRLQDVPTVFTELYKVTGSDFTPDIKNRVTQRTVTLTRHGGTLPTIV